MPLEEIAYVKLLWSSKCFLFLLWIWILQQLLQINIVSEKENAELNWGLPGPALHSPCALPHPVKEWATEGRQTL